jgi:hypothetical protein
MQRQLPSILALLLATLPVEAATVKLLAVVDTKQPPGEIGGETTYASGPGNTFFAASESTTTCCEQASASASVNTAQGVFKARAGTALHRRRIKEQAISFADAAPPKPPGPTACQIVGRLS